MAPEATNGGHGNGGSLAMEAAQNKKPRKRKKPRSSSSSAASRSATPSSTLPTTSSSLPRDGDGGGACGQQRQLPSGVLRQQQLHRGKQRVVWTPELHDVFLKACNVLGKDAVPKKILALMNVEGISREHVASHLQKYRLSLRREEQRVPDKVKERPPPLHAEASSQTPSSSRHPPATAPASSSLHPLPPPQEPFAALTMHGHQQLVQTPPDCFSSSNNNNAPTNLNVHPHPGFPMVQPIQQCFTPPLQATIAMPMQWNKLVKKLQAGYNNTTMQQAAAAASGHNHNPMLLIRNNVAQTLAIAPQMQASQVVVSMTGESSVPEANVVKDEETEIRSLAHLLMAVEAEEGQGRAAEREAAEEMAATAEEGQGQAAEPGAAETAAKGEEGQGRAAEPGAPAGGSLSSAGSSIHGQYWKIDDTEVSWDFSGFHRYKSD